MATIICSGIPSGLGLPGSSQASVQSFLSNRQGFPVKDRDRTVSRDVALRYDSICLGGTSASSTVSHSDPVHTPAAPMTMAAAIWRPDPTPPAAGTGMGATASMTSGHRTIEPTSPVWPPPSEPWQMTMSTPAAWWFIACVERIRHQLDLVVAQDDLDRLSAPHAVTVASVLQSVRSPAPRPPP